MVISSGHGLFVFSRLAVTGKEHLATADACDPNPNPAFGGRHHVKISTASKDGGVSGTEDGD